MKDFIYLMIVGGLFAVNAWSLYKARSKNNFVYRIVLFTRHKDWLWSILLIAGMITVGSLVEPHVPKILKWSVFSILDKDGTNANIAIVEGFGSAKASASMASLIISKIFLLIIYTIFILILPKAAYWEEKTYRYGTTEFNTKTVYRNIKFGLMHCVIGVPIWIGLLLALVGMVLAFRYIKEYRDRARITITTSEYPYKVINSEYPHEMAVLSSTSLHGKYNIILLTLIFLSIIV